MFSLTQNVVALGSTHERSSSHRGNAGSASEHDFLYNDPIRASRLGTLWNAAGAGGIDICVSSRCSKNPYLWNRAPARWDYEMRRVSDVC